MSDLDCQLQLQTGAYLLGALQPEEAELHREHLQVCTICRRELEELQASVRALPRSAKPARASETLVGRIMAQVRSEAELLNAAGAHADRVRTRTAWWGSRRMGALTVAAMIALVAVLGTALIASESSTNQRVTRALVATSAPGGRAELRQSGVRAELVLAKIPQPAPGKIYQVWVVHANGAPQPTNALFSVSANGSASVDVPDLRHIQRLMVTAEPDGGSTHPTSSPIITATLKPS